MLTREQKVQIVKWFYGGHPMNEIANNLFVLAFDVTVNTSSIFHVIHLFEETGSVNPPCKCLKEQRPQSEESEMREIMVRNMIANNDTLSTRAVAEDPDINAGKSTVHRLLKRNSYKSFKVKTTQEIFPADHGRRMEFCEDMMDRINNNDQFLQNILFSDESTFPLHGRHNPSVVRYWSQENKHRRITLRTQYPQKLNVWAGILGDTIIGPHFIEGNLNGQKYLELLQNQVIPAVQGLENIDMAHIWYQHDGCPAHNAAGEYLNQIFPHRIISTYGDIKWPPRSPELSPNDFFLWGEIKQTIYTHHHQRANNLDELRLKIVEATQNITPAMLREVRQEFYDRLGYCLAQQGDVFEHLIR